MTWLVNCRLSGLKRQNQPEHGTNAARILTGEITTMCPGVAASDRQTQTRATSVVRSTMIKPHQPLEDPHPFRRWHARTRVPDFGNRILIMFTNHHVHRALRSSCPHGVVDHVADDAADLGSVGITNVQLAGTANGEMSRLYRLGLNGKIRSDDMTRFVYVLREIRACLEAEVLTDVQQRLALLSRDMDNHNGHRVTHQPTFPRS